MQTVLNFAEEMQQLQGRLKIDCAGRKGVEPAHRLANWARVKGEHRVGLNYVDIIAPDENVRIFDSGILKRM
jgi:hypothetical protein